MSRTVTKIKLKNKSETLISVKNLDKRYNEGKKNEVRVLKGINFEIPSGQMVAIMGPSGCGKTTLLNVIGGLDKYSSGSIEVGGRLIGEISEKEMTDFRMDNMGFIFQLFNLFDSQTAIENVSLPLLLQEYSPSEALQKSAMMLQEVGLGDRMAHFPGELSGGQQQRVAISRALITDPILLLGDEPTGDLDSATSADIMQLFKRMISENPKMSMVLVTHSQTIANQCDRIIRIENGVVASDEEVN
jgi:putative ABC transport system ATP-binding protein